MAGAILYRNTHVIIYHYDARTRESFDALRQSIAIQNIRQHKTGDSVEILVVNNAEESENRKVDPSEGKNLADSISAKFFELTSDASNFNDFEMVLESALQDTEGLFPETINLSGAPITSSSWNPCDNAC